MGACASGNVLPFGYNTKRLTREQIELVDKYLPDFRFYEVSSEAHLHLAAAHWNKVFAEGNSGRSTRTSNSSASTVGRQSAIQSKVQGVSKIAMLYDTFYAYLAQDAPELQPVFRSSMHVRSKVLLHISAGMREILTNQFAVERLMALTKTHLGFGVKLEYFNTLGKALMHAMQVASDEAWTPEVENAWRRLFAHSSAILLVYHRRQVGAQEESGQAKEQGPEMDDLLGVKQ